MSKNAASIEFKRALLESGADVRSARFTTEWRGRAYFTLTLGVQSVEEFEAAVRAVYPDAVIAAKYWPQHQTTVGSVRIGNLK